MMSSPNRALTFADDEIATSTGIEVLARIRRLRELRRGLREAELAAARRAAADAELRRVQASEALVKRQQELRDERHTMNGELTQDSQTHRSLRRWRNKEAELIEAHQCARAHCADAAAAATQAHEEEVRRAELRAHAAVALEKIDAITDSFDQNFGQ